MLAKLSVLITVVASALTASAGPIAVRQSACAPLIHLHAAGTGESGLGIVGAAFRTSLPRTVSGASVQAINYNTAAEYSATVAAGARTAASQIQSLAAQCPDAKFSLSGYSKVIHSTSRPSPVYSH